MKLPYAFSIIPTKLPHDRLIIADSPVFDHTRRIPTASASIRPLRSSDASSLARLSTSVRSCTRAVTAEVSSASSMDVSRSRLRVAE